MILNLGLVGDLLLGLLLRIEILVLHLVLGEVVLLIVAILIILVRNVLTLCYLLVLIERHRIHLRKILVLIESLKSLVCLIKSR